jgi:hypothetical protein
MVYYFGRRAQKAAPEMASYTNRQAKVHKKQQLITPSLRFPLQAGGTKTLRFPSRSEGNLKEGGNCEL